MKDAMSVSHQISLRDTISKLLNDSRAALAEAPRWQRGFQIFWLLGPFILLIERSPADAWLTILALAFVVRAVIKRDGNFLRAFWVQAAFLFWGVCLLSAAVSAIPAYSLGEAFIWIRFPLFAMASVYWLGQDKRLLYAMFMSTAIGMMVMTGILTAEILIIGPQNGRLSWPYGDLVPGNYLTKVGLPAFAVMIALAVSPYKSVRGWASLASLITIILSVITGERINFILRACGGMLAGLIWRPSLYRYGALILIEILAIATVFTVTPDTGNRFTQQFMNEMPVDAGSPYYRVMYGAVVVYEEAPILGIGTANYRILCDELTQHVPEVNCNTHPHNYYLQMLGETGIIGLIFGSIMIISIIWFCFVTGMRGRANVLAATAFIVPLGLFFPIQTTADFFGQWNNIFMWSAIALALATRNLVASDGTTSQER